MIYKVDLPPPHPGIIKYCLENILGTHLDWAYTWHDQFIAPHIPAGTTPVSSYIHPFLPESLVFKQINIQYKTYFSKPVRPAIVMFTNNSTDHKFASLVPHCDKNRTFSINYIIEQGGAEVTTSFYREGRENPDLSVAEFGYPNQLTLENVYVCPKNSWSMLNVQQYHGVDNIESTRIVFMLMSLDNFDRSVEEIYKELEHLTTPLEPINKD